MHPRITQALLSLDEIMAIEPIEMDEETHLTFLQAYKRAATLQKEVETVPEGSCQYTSQEMRKSQVSPETSEEDEEDITLIVPKALKPLQAPFM